MLTCAKDKNLLETSFLPNMASVVGSFMQSVKVAIVQSQQIDGKTQKIPLWFDARACVQPMAENLVVRKEGERSWKWSVIYMQTDKTIETDDVICLFGVSYKVMSKFNWEYYGFVEYQVIETYTKL